jgi:hypothetical protein
VQFEDCTTCDSALEVYETFLDALKGLEEARKCICELHTENNIIVMSSKFER